MSILVYMKRMIYDFKEKIKDQFKNNREYKNHYKKIKTLKLSHVLEVKENGSTYLLFTEDAVTDQVRRNIMKAILEQEKVEDNKVTNSMKEAVLEQPVLQQPVIPLKRENKKENAGISMKSTVKVKGVSQQKEKQPQTTQAPVILGTKMKSK